MLWIIWTWPNYYIRWKVFIPVEDLDVKGNEYGKLRIYKLSQSTNFLKAWHFFLKAKHLYIFQVVFLISPRSTNKTIFFPASSFNIIQTECTLLMLIFSNKKNHLQQPSSFLSIFLSIVFHNLRPGKNSVDFCYRHFSRAGWLFCFFSAKKFNCLLRNFYICNL